MAVYSPVTQRFLGGFTGTEGEGSTFDIPCGYICPVGFSVLDHNIRYEYNYVLVAGELEEMRKEIYTLAEKDRMDFPVFEFADTRQGWYYRNARDAGWPIKGKLDIRPAGGSFSLVGPDISFEAVNISELEITAAMETKTGTFSFLWSRIEGSERTAPDSVVMSVIPGSGFQKYNIDLTEVADFKGLITGIHFNFPDMEKDDRVMIESIYFK